jgi:hypothetical protein
MSSFPVESEWRRRTTVPHGVVSAGMEIFTLTPNQFNLNNWDLNQ